MAGSKVAKLYTQSTDGAKYNVIVDESNAEACGFGVADPTYGNLPSSYTMRYVLGYFATATNIRRKLWIGNPVLWEALMGEVAPSLELERYPAMPPETFRISFFGGEQYKVPILLDTGINDGDA